MAGGLSVLMVAEKPAIAEALAGALGGDSARRRRGLSPRAPVFEFSGEFRAERAQYTVTAVAGHIYSLDFNKEYNDWRRHGPEELFAAPVVHQYDAQARFPEHLAKEATGCQVLVLWLDCDREGENICFEVIRNALPAMDRSRSFDGAFQGCIFRAHFSSLCAADLCTAMGNLGVPNKNESDSVDARAEIDLRLGIAFSRFQTEFFRKNPVPELGNQARQVTYGPCQMPTLWFCVHRYCQIKKFVPEPFWLLRAKFLWNGQSFPAEAACGKMLDRGEADRLLMRVSCASQARVTSVTSHRATKQRPLPLNTVSMLQAASRLAGLSPGDAMHYAEKLYLKGIFSYPRTETARYPPTFDVTALLHELRDAPRGVAPWGDLAARVAAAQTDPRSDGADHGDHSPITPVRWASEAECGDAASWELYQLVCRYFFASISPDCEMQETEVELDLAGVPMVAASTRRTSSGLSWCEVIGAPLEEVGAVDLATMPRGSSCIVGDSTVARHSTEPPPYLNEADLLGLMEEHGIGTDASMAQHISNVAKRGYVQVELRSRQLRPTPLGLALSHAYTLVDPGLVRPSVRSGIEAACNRVARGEARKQDVVTEVVSVFEEKYKNFCEHVHRVQEMLKVAFAPDRFHAPEADVARWDSAVDATADISLDDLLSQRREVEGKVAMLREAPVGQQLAPGSEVSIFGLHGAPHLNGLEGVCDHWDLILERWLVKVKTGSEMSMKAIKAGNLRIKGATSTSATKAQRPQDLRPGAVVQIHGLSGAPQLNGQQATCDRWDAASGRWHVTLRSGETKALKPVNMQEMDGRDAKRAKIPMPPAPAKPTFTREDLKRHVFWRCDADTDGFLNREEMLVFATLTGFDGTEIQWRNAYNVLCSECDADPLVGIPEAAMMSLMDDQTDSGFYCTDAELKSFA